MTIIQLLCFTRWKSNATDLAMMNQSNSSSHSGIATNLGWTPVDAEAQESPDAIKEAEAKLRNDGRELRSSEQQTSQGSPGGGQSKATVHKTSSSTTAASQSWRLVYILQACLM